MASPKSASTRWPGRAGWTPVTAPDEIHWPGSSAIPRRAISSSRKRAAPIAPSGKAEARPDADLHSVDPGDDLPVLEAARRANPRPRRR